jgi:hypothetical protein
LLDRGKGDLLHHLLHSMSLTKARKGHRSQPAVVLGENCRPIDRGSVHPLVSAFYYYCYRCLAVLVKNGHNHRSIIR